MEVEDDAPLKDDERATAAGKLVSLNGTIYVIK